MKVILYLLCEKAWNFISELQMEMTVELRSPWGSIIMCCNVKMN